MHRTASIGVAIDAGIRKRLIDNRLSDVSHDRAININVGGEATRRSFRRDDTIAAAKQRGSSMFCNLFRRLGVDRGSPGRTRGGRFRLSGSLGALTALLCAVLAAPAWSLGLGEIELESALNERLDAEIELLEASGLQPNEIVVSLGSAEDFRRVGVERFFFLTDLKFEVATSGSGAVVKVTSGQPITEPYLNFLIEVLWPNGRLLKEYTLLLDPPTFSQAAAPVVQRPALSAAPSQSAGRVQRTPERAPERPQPARSSGTQVQLDGAAAAGPSPLDEGIVDGEYRMTDRNDTLWDIASATLPGSGITVQQNMLALQRLNPDAFIGGNINLLKAGYVLRLPTEAEARALTAAAANQKVAEQNQAWRTGAPTQVAAAGSPAAEAPAAPQGSGAAEGLRPQVDATSRGDGQGSDAPSQSGELRIVAGTGDSATGQGGADSEVLNAALEEQDRLAREVDELTYQLDREKELAASQIEVKERQLEVKDQQIAELQTQLEQLREQNRLAGSAPPAQQTQSASPQAAQAPWWQSPYLLYGGAGALVLLLVGGMVAARRRRLPDDEEAFYAEQGMDAFDEPAGTAARVEPAFDDVELGADAARAQDTLLDEDAVEEGDDILALDEADDAAVLEVDEAAPRDSETGDVIGEADIYIAYGRYPQAIGLLLGVLESSPERNDVRLKLLEVYADVKDRDAFDSHLAQLMEHCDDEDALLTARELESSFGDDDLGAPADDDPRASNIEYEPPTTADAEELEALSFDDDGDDEDLIRTAAEAGVEAEPGVEAADATLDFELELDELESVDGSADASLDLEDAGAGDELGGDLGMDFDPERDVDESLEEDVSAGAPLELDTEELSLDDVLGGEVPDDEAGTEFEADSSSEVATVAEDEFEFDEEGDSASTKLDLARAYIDMGDADGARDILQEVVGEGSSEQRQQAQALLDSI